MLYGIAADIFPRLNRHRYRSALKLSNHCNLREENGMFRTFINSKRRVRERSQSSSSNSITSWSCTLPDKREVVFWFSIHSAELENVVVGRKRYETFPSEPLASTEEGSVAQKIRHHECDHPEENYEHCWKINRSSSRSRSEILLEFFEHSLEWECDVTSETSFFDFRHFFEGGWCRRKREKKQKEGCLTGDRDMHLRRERVPPSTCETMKEQHDSRQNNKKKH